MIGPLQLVIAFFLDLLIGDPRWLPHPVRIIGKGVSSAESFLRSRCSTPSGERRAGVLLVLVIVVPAFLITHFVLVIARMLPGSPGAIAGMAVTIYLVSTTLAIHELIASALAVIRPVKEGNIEKARHSLSMIVGRDTQNLSREDILKATMETLAENLSDGFVAPLFYLVIGGLPLAMAYKAINTLDSMVGYNNDTHRHFGWAAARLDDLANYLPARVTGLLIVCAAFPVGTVLFSATGKIEPSPFLSARSSFNTMLRDGRKHLSPNSGMPEAAMAGALGIRMGGPSTYGGVVVDKPYIGGGGETASDYLIASERGIAIAKFASVIGISLAVLILAARRIA